MGRTLGVNSILNRNFKTFGIAGQWQEALGDISRPFKWLVYGKPKNGKTTMLLQFCKYISQFAKVYYNSMEEGHGKTFQQALLRADFSNVKPGKFMVGDRDSFEEMMAKLKKNKAQVVVIDSRDYMNLTVEQYKQMIETYPRKSFVIVCWEQGGNPKGNHAKDIEFMVDMVTRVANFRAITNGRFGAGLKYTISGHAQQQELF